MSGKLAKIENREIEPARPETARRKIISFEKIGSGSFGLSVLKNEYEPGLKKTNLALGLAVEKETHVDGLTLALAAGPSSMNGVGIGILCGNIEGSRSDTYNGVSVGLLASAGNETINGASVGGLIGGGDKVNGLTIGGLAELTPEVNGLKVAGGLAFCLKRIRGVGIGGLIGAFEDAEGLVVGGLLNICGRLKGLMVGLVNIVARPSTGVQIGLLNIRTDAPWYAKVIPGIAIRYAGLTERSRAKKQFSGLAVLISQSAKAESIRQSNRLKILLEASEGQVSKFLPQSTYRLYGEEPNVPSGSEAFGMVKGFVDAKNLSCTTSVKIEGQLFWTAIDGNPDLVKLYVEMQERKGQDCASVRKKAAGELAAIGSDPELYGEDVSNWALKQLIMLAKAPKDNVTGKKEAIDALASLGLAEDAWKDSLVL